MTTVHGKNRSQSNIALISAGAALLGSIVGVSGGLFGTHLQSTAEDRRMERSERQAAYVRLIAAVEAAGSDLAASEPCESRGSPQRDTVQLANDQMESVRNAAAEVYLVGSVAAAAASERIATTADDVAVGILLCETSPTSGVQELYDELDAFTSLARSDIAGRSR
ncbi:hypothetical protein [Georgenia subflava]|uniref:Uncharacterized protein n=1 Tax=Georgenia subflava TaxID=1622177 RepID=A0A6N7EIU0_9MICO|nr:hypothetical protein [Georgenia subflava]MPV36993.1 hypothetical protein [Georgenia subflava]